MNPKLLLFLFLLMHPGSYACSRELSCGLDTIKHHQKKRVYTPHAQYTRSHTKGYKPWFDDCKFSNRYSLQQRLKQYPFTQATKILVVSYAGSDDNSPLNPSHLDEQHLKGLVIIKNRLDYSTLLEIRTANDSLIRRLTNIIYNYDYKVTINDKNVAEPGHSCYNPHNAFIFLDRQGNVIDYLEVCFECENYKSMHDKIFIGDDCNQKYEMLRKCFVDLGIKHGTQPSSHRK